MVLVCGEALMDVFAVATTASGLSLDARIGGSPLNVAIGLSRLGQRCAFLGGVSNDAFGERLVSAMLDEGINIDSLARLDSPTTLVMVSVNAKGKPTYQFIGTGAADRQLQAQHLHNVPRNFQAIHLGSYCTVTEPTASTLQALVMAESGRCVIAFDPNVRTSVEADLALWRARFEFMINHASIIKLSDEELELLYPGEDPQRIANRCLSADVALVLLTRGPNGASAWTRQGRIDVAAPIIQLIDTVGAGDSFQAAVIAWLAEQGLLTKTGMATLSNMHTADMLKFAVTAAATTCTRRGADLPRRSELGNSA